MNAMFENYQKEIVPALMKELELKNIMSTPKLVKVVVNMGIGDAKDSREEQQKALDDLSRIAGQKPSIRASRQSIAGFGVREGQPVGVAVTLRGRKMYDFLQKLINIVLPRIRDFRGVPGKLDNRGNYTLGLSEHTVFPEIDLAKVNKVRGLEITIVTSTSDKDQARKLLEKLGTPFVK